MSTYNLVREAIINRRIVIATYKGYQRRMCPHVIGRKNGREQALLYQFAGGSSSGLGGPGSPRNWRCLFLDQLEDVSIEDGEWHTGANHSRPQTCVGQIEVEVSY